MKPRSIVNDLAVPSGIVFGIILGGGVGILITNAVLPSDIGFGGMPILLALMAIGALIGAVVLGLLFRLMASSTWGYWPLRIMLWIGYLAPFVLFLWYEVAGFIARLEHPQ